MPVSCPPQIKQLMTITILWERFLGFDGHAEPSYAAPKALKCWREEYSVTAGGEVAIRMADGTVVEPQWHLYFSGDDPDAQKMQLYDRFTVTPKPWQGTGPVGDSEVQKLQAVRVNTMHGPNFDNRNPWVIEVAL